MNDNYYALEIPSGIDYLPIKDKLDQMEKDEIIGYAETCLSTNHKYGNIDFHG